MVRMSFKVRKAQILDEYCSNTGQSRKYAMRRLRAGPRNSGVAKASYLFPGGRGVRKARTCRRAT